MKLFSWMMDEEGSIAFVLLNIIAFVKYKEHTILRIVNKEFKPAGKYQGQG